MRSSLTLKTNIKFRCLSSSITTKSFCHNGDPAMIHFERQHCTHTERSSISWFLLCLTAMQYPLIKFQWFFDLIVAVSAIFLPFDFAQQANGTNPIDNPGYSETLDSTTHIHMAKMFERRSNREIVMKGKCHRQY